MTPLIVIASNCVGRVSRKFLGCREAVRAMKETGCGSIVNLSSVAGIIGDASPLAYCARKGAST